MSPREQVSKPWLSYLGTRLPPASFSGGSDEPYLSRELGQGELRESLGLVTLAISSKLVQPLLG